MGKSTLKLINKAIQASDIGINPTDDGSVIRLVFPAPTEERRKELCKQVSKDGESAKVAIRNIRREAVDKLKAQKKANEISEDDLKDAEKDVQDLTDKYVKQIEKAVKRKRTGSYVPVRRHRRQCSARHRFAVPGFLKR